MKKLILFALLFGALSSGAQVIKTSGVTYVSGTPAYTPSALGSEISVDTATGILYLYNRGATTWYAVNGVEIGGGSGSPVHTPGDNRPRFFLNGDHDLYFWTGATWVQLNAGGGGGIYDDGANTIGAGVVATMQEDEILEIRYFNDERAIYINDGSGTISIVSGDGQSGFAAEPDYFEMVTDGGASVILESGDARILSGGVGVVKIQEFGGNVTIGGFSTASQLQFLEPDAGGTNSISLEAPALDADVNLILPIADGTNGQALITDGAGQLGFATVGGANEFTDLTDVPSSYTGQGGKLVAVNSGETALEFIPVSSPTTLTGMKFLIYNDETAGTEHNTSTAESAALKTYSLAANSYDKIMIEAIITARIDPDANNKDDFTFRIKEAGVTVATFEPRVIGVAASGADGGGRYVETVSTIIDGGQGVSTDLTITVQISVSNANIGANVLAFRVWGIRDVELVGLTTGTDLTMSGASSPVTLNSSTGTDVTLTAGTNVTFSQSANNLTINASGGGGSPSVITPAEITADQNDYTPTGWADATLIRLSGDNGCRAIRGFGAETSGETKTLKNVGSYPLYLAPEHASSTAANRISHFEEVFLMPGQSAQIYYDGTLSRWSILTDPCPNYLTPRKSVHYDLMPTKVPEAVSENFPLFIWGSITLSNTAPTSTIPFMAWDMNTGSTASGGAGIAYVRDEERMAYYGGAHIIAKTIIKTPATIGDATNNYYYFCRIASNPSSGFFTQNNSVGIYYRYSDNSGKWWLRSTDSGGTSTETDSGVTFSVDTEYELLVTINKALNEVTFFINGVVVGRHTTNLPSATSCGPSVQLEKTAGTSARSIYTYRFIGAAIAP